MNRALRHILVVLMLLITVGVMAQKPGVRPMEVSAIDYLFQPTQPWSGSKFTEALPLDERFYVNLSTAPKLPWNYFESFDNSLWTLSNKVALGYKLAPVHALEMNLSWDYARGHSNNYFSGGFSYLFNLTSYASRIEKPRAWELSFVTGFDLDYNIAPSVSAHFGARLQRNVSESFGIYLEPAVTAVGYAHSESGLVAGQFAPSLALGVSLNPARVKNSIDRAITKKREWWESVGYVRVPIIAFKTNLLFDALTLINVELEVPIGKHFSVAGEWMFPWWTNDDGTATSERNRTQLLNATLELKYWFGGEKHPSVMTGWFAGVFSSGGLYDFERDAQGYQGEFYVALGVSGGYAHTLNKRGNLRMEYELGFGYLQTDYAYYEAFYDPTLLQWRPVMYESGRYSVFTPLRAKVSLSWLITRKKRL